MNTILEFYVPEKIRKEYQRRLKIFFPCEFKTVESGIYAYSEQFCGADRSQYSAIYIDKCKDILYNCGKHATNETVCKLIDDVNNGEYNGYNLAYLHPEELDMESWKKILKRKQTSEDKMNDLPSIKWEPCENCGCTQYFFSQMQTRSADEPMTRYYDCKECKRRYKNCN